MQLLILLKYWPFSLIQSSSVCLRAPVSESLSRLGRDQLQKFAQYLISELPQHVWHMFSYLYVRCGDDDDDDDDDDEEGKDDDDDDDDDEEEEEGKEDDDGILRWEEQYALHPAICSREFIVDVVFHPCSVVT